MSICNGKYKIENLEILNMEREKGWNDKSTYFEIETTLNERKKLEIIDSLTNCFGTYMYDILTKWEGEKDSLPKDEYGHVKIVSKKAWIKRNDKRNRDGDYSNIDAWYKYGSYCMRESVLTVALRIGLKNLIMQRCLLKSTSVLMINGGE